MYCQPITMDYVIQVIFASYCKHLSPTSIPFNSLRLALPPIIDDLQEIPRFETVSSKDLR